MCANLLFKKKNPNMLSRVFYPYWIEINLPFERFSAPGVF